MTELEEKFLNACKDEQLNDVKECVKAGVNVDAIHPAEQNTALMFASQNGRTETVEFLIANNADTNIQNEHGDTALILASFGKYVEITKLLLKAHIDINMQNDKGYRTAR